MTKIEIENLIAKQKSFFDSGVTMDVDTRVKYLKKLRTYLTDNEKELAAAVKKDLGKHPIETFMCEIGQAKSEINYMLMHIRSMTREKLVPTPIIQFPAHSVIKRVPYGTVLIVSPWNYPIMLSVIPLIDAIAAGNTAIVKPSACAPNTAAAIEKMLTEIFPEEYVKVICGDRAENEALFDCKFDYIFFTGGKSAGRLVAEKAAKTLTPVTLELGGKNPCIVDKTANLRIAARRIVFGKFLNCGQTCVAPDYILCESSVKDKFVECLKEEIHRQYDDNTLSSLTYCNIINEKHFDRITRLIDYDKVVYGGRAEKCILRIEPTVMDNVTREDAIMQEEIFGPVLPVLTYDDLAEEIDRINSGAKPLASYFFSCDKSAVNYFKNRLAFGGGCINDTLVHMISPYSPFGGVGESGMGSYRGKDGFDTFSHKKSILDKPLWLDLRPRYQPYTIINEFLTRFFLH